MSSSVKELQKKGGKQKKKAGGGEVGKQNGSEKKMRGESKTDLKGNIEKMAFRNKNSPLILTSNARGK